MLEPPQYIVCLIAVVAKIGGMAMSIERVPHRTPVLFPPLRDGVADEQQIDVALAYARHGAFMSFHPPGLRLRGGTHGFNLSCERQ